MPFQLHDSIIVAKPGLGNLDLEALSAIFVPAAERAQVARLFTKVSPAVAARLKHFVADESRFATPQTPVALPIRFVEGGTLIVVFWPDALGAFETQSYLAKTFAPELKAFEGERVVLHTDRLEAFAELAIVVDFARLLKLEEWTVPAQKGDDAKSKRAKPRQLKLELRARTDGATLDRLVEEAIGLAEATNLVRTLAELPANSLDPVKYLERVKDLVRGKGLELEFLDEKKLAKLGAGAFLAVVAAKPGQGAGIVRVRYRPRGKGKSRGKLALVGKGLCFDTGGYNVKTEMHMRGMKHDMTGSAVALAVLMTIARFELPIETEAFLALAENHVSPTGFKADDVVTAVNGKTIEIVHTDAEGRMVLADTLALAAREKPDLILDFATLTGSVMRALDTRRSGVYSNREALLLDSFEAGEACGERVWPFPTGGDYRELLKTEVADLLQCLDDGKADHIYAATFLREFVGETSAWIHVDLAASSNKGGLGLVTGKTTGFGVLWAYEMIHRHFKLNAKNA